MSQSLTLYDLEKRLVELMDLWSDTELEQDHRDQIAMEIKAYLEAEISKVDGIRGYLRHCEVIENALREEATAQLERAKQWKTRRERLKEYCVEVMGMIGATKLEGRTGVLAVRGNGGKQPVTIDNAEMIPEEFCCWEGMVTGVAVKALLEIPGGVHWFGRQDVQLSRTPRKSLIEAELQKPCDKCGGLPMCRDSRAIPGAQIDMTCPACGGSGKRGVPGCRLEPRGSHLEIK